MFLVNDGIERRERRVRSFLRREPIIAVLLAAGNFEGTLYRAIISLGQDPNVELRERLSRIYGLESYKEFWREGTSPIVALHEITCALWPRST